MRCSHLLIHLGPVAVCVCVFVFVFASVGSTSAGAQVTASVTFADHIASIVHAKCTACHRPGQSAPFPLITFADVRKRARQIADVTRSRYMPPWLPMKGHGEFRHDRSLTTEQIAMIQKWVDGGALEGDPKRTPKAPVFPDGWELGKPDLVIEPTGSYTLRAAGRDAYRNIVIPVRIDRPRYVRALELRFRTPRAVHHAIVQQDRSGTCRKLDAEEEDEGFGGMTMGQSIAPGGRFFGWTPGNVQDPGDGSAIFEIRPGDDFVVQLHLVPTGKPEKMRPMIGFFFTDKPPTKTSYALVLRNDRIDVPPGDADHLIEDHFVLPTDVKAVSVYPHAHYLGKMLHGFARLPDGSKRWLVRIDKWDFNWQDSYAYREPIDLPRGTVIQLRYIFDNSEDNVLNPNSPPIRVRAGNRSVDEMATLTLQCEFSKPSDYHVFDLAVWRREIERSAKNWVAHYNLANGLRTAGRHQEAIQHYKVAAKINGKFGPIYNNLGSTLNEIQRYGEATKWLEKALEIDRKADTLNNLANAVRRLGQNARARKLFEEAIRLAPDDAIIHNNYGNALRAGGLLAEAHRALERSLALDPNSAIARTNFGFVLENMRRYGEAVGEFRRAVKLNDEIPPAHTRLAVILSAAPETNLRDLKQAIRHAVRAVRLTGSRDPRAFDALSIVHAANGRFEDAIKAVSIALQMTPVDHRAPLLDRLARYRAKRPFVLAK